MCQQRFGQTYHQLGEAQRLASLGGTSGLLVKRRVSVSVRSYPPWKSYAIKGVKLRTKLLPDLSVSLQCRAQTKCYLSIQFICLSIYLFCLSNTNNHYFCSRHQCWSCLDYHNRSPLSPPIILCLCLTNNNCA